MPEKRPIEELDEIQKTTRITATLGILQAKIVEALANKKYAKSQSAVVNKIIERWIDDHLEEIEKKWKVDVSHIMGEITTYEDDLQKLKEIKENIQGVKKIKIDDLAQVVEMNRANMLRLVIKNTNLLNAEIDGDYIIPK